MVKYIFAGLIIFSYSCQSKLPYLQFNPQNTIIIISDMEWIVKTVYLTEPGTEEKFKIHLIDTCDLKDQAYFSLSESSKCYESDTNLNYFHKKNNVSVTVVIDQKPELFRVKIYHFNYSPLYDEEMKMLIIIEDRT